MGIRAEFTPGIICDGIAGVGSAGSSFRLYHSSNFSERVALFATIENQPVRPDPFSTGLRLVTTRS